MGTAFVQSSELPLRVNLPDRSGQTGIDVARLAEINPSLSVHDDARPRVCRRGERREAEVPQNCQKNAEVVFHRMRSNDGGLDSDQILRTFSKRPEPSRQGRFR